MFILHVLKSINMYIGIFYFLRIYLKIEKQIKHPGIYLCAYFLRLWITKKNLLILKCKKRNCLTEICFELNVKKWGKFTATRASPAAVINCWIYSLTIYIFHIQTRLINRISKKTCFYAFHFRCLTFASHVCAIYLSLVIWFYFLI